MAASNRTPKDAADPRPLHERIATDLRREILAGKRKPGSRLPTTEQLKERFTASSATVQKALSLLKAEGLAAGRAGASVTVLEHRRKILTPAAYSKPAEAGQSYRWLTEAQKGGYRPTIELLEVGEVQPDPEVAELLGLAEGETAVLRKQLLSLDDEPCEVVESYYPLEIARGTALTEHKKIKGGTPTLLAEMGYPPVNTVDEVTADEATQEEYALLRLPTRLPVLRTVRVVYSRDEHPIEVTTMVKAGHLHGLRYSF